MRKFGNLVLPLLVVIGFCFSGNAVMAGNYESNRALFGNYSTYKMEGYNFRSHTSLNRVNYKRSFTLHRVYDKDRRSYRALRKLNKKK